MKSCDFTLEAVLDLRATAKERAQEDLAIALRKCEQAAAASSAAENKLVRMGEELREGRFTASQRYQGWNALCRQEEMCRARQNALAEAENEALSRRAQLISASIDHELVLRLKQKWLEARARAEAHRVERQLEEFVNGRRNLNRYLL